METSIIKGANRSLEFQYIILYIRPIALLGVLLQESVSYLNLQLLVHRKYKTDYIYFFRTWTRMFNYGNRNFASVVGGKNMS